MTWYSQQIIAQPREQVVSSLLAIPHVAEHGFYFVPHLRELETEEQIVDGAIFGDDGSVDLRRTVRSGPKLPPDGLLVVRELCRSDDVSLSRWFGDDALLCDTIGAGLPASNDPLLQYDTLFADAPAGWRAATPPQGLLEKIRTISLTTKSVIAYYVCHMWGGDVERVFGWVWDGEQGTSCFYRGICSTDDDGKETAGFYTDLTGAYAIDRSDRRLIVDGDVLTLLLLHFGLLLRDGYFELHRRSFPWENYKIDSSGI